MTNEGTSPESTEQSYSKSIIAIIIGSIAIAAGIFITIASYQASDEGGQYALMWGLVLFGFISLGMGIVGIIRTTQIRKGKVTSEGEAGVDALLGKITFGKVVLFSVAAIIILTVLAFILILMGI